MTIENPLHKFRQYTPHYALVAASSTAALMQFYQNADDTQLTNSLTKYNHPPGGINTRYQAQGDDNSKYVVLFNSTTDAEFYVDKLKFTSILQRSPSDLSTSFNTCDLAMELQIVEPYTVDFITTFQYAATNLNVAPVQLIFLIKIFFVGYTYEDKVEFVSYVSPVTFRITNVDMSLTEAGAEYKLTCVPDNSAGSVAKDNTIGGIQVQMRTTIKDAIADLNEALAIKANKYYEHIKDNKYTFIQYKILLDPAYEDVRYKLNNISADDTNYFPGVPEDKPLQYNAGSTDVVANAIDHIMALSTAVSEDAVADQIPGEGHSSVYRIITYNNLTPDGRQIIYYYVLKQILTIKGSTDISIEADQQSMETAGEAIYNATTYDKQNPTPEPLINNDSIATIAQIGTETSSYIEYDYIYTGKNVDILQYHMVLPWASNSAPFMLYMAGNPNTNKEYVDRASNQQNPQFAANLSETAQHEETEMISHNLKGQFVNNNTPIGPPIPDPYGIATGSAMASSFYQARMAVSKFISNTQVKAGVEIYGNPLLMHNMIQTPDLYFDSQAQPHSMDIVKQNLNNRIKQKGLGGYLSSSPMVKINVRVPKPTYLQGRIVHPNVDQNNVPFDPEYENKFSTAFWNLGLYSIMKIDHIFDKNKFTQSLHLMVYPLNENGGVEAHKSGSATAPSTTLIPNKPSSKTKFTTKEQLAQRQLIWDKLSAKGLPPVAVAGIVGNMQLESGLNPNISEIGGGGGYGLIQWDDRKPALLKEAARLGVDPGDVDFQIDYLMKEFNTTERNGFNQLMKASTPEEASDAFCLFVERPAGTYKGSFVAAGSSTLHRVERQQAARDAYNAAYNN